MVKLKVLIPFFDIEVGFKRLRNSEFERSKDRAKVLINHESKLVEILEIKKYASK
jgi:hypothetical protein